MSINNYRHSIQVSRPHSSELFISKMSDSVLLSRSQLNQTHPVVAAGIPYDKINA